MVVAPEQGSLIFVSLDPTLGHEQKGRRPALVVSAGLFNGKTGFCWVVPITSHSKGLPLECVLPEGLAVHGAILLSQLRSIDWRARPFEVVGKVTEEFFADVCARLRAVLP